MVKTNVSILGTTLPYSPTPALGCVMRDSFLQVSCKPILPIIHAVVFVQ